ncbi:hypothetical protein RRG08_020688 [Elysia crispata]|uniref:Uncharacterized protein n=1 Tax=Elysia crispata TaxID=231223 RepID=A0AAE0Z4Q1_9GAST|nr:hypothetical protein RRG08_020688 [Elysia crispata]
MVLLLTLRFSTTQKIPNNGTEPPAVQGFSFLSSFKLKSSRSKSGRLPELIKCREEEDWVGPINHDFHFIIRDVFDLDSLSFDSDI